MLLPAALRAELVNKVVLRVNDQIATLYDYEQRRAGMAEEILRQQDLGDEERRQLLSQVGELAFKDMFEELLIESRAEQLGVEVAETQVDQQVGQMKKNFGIENDEQFAAALAQSGMTEPQLRERLRRDMRAREVMGREVQSKIQLDEDDLRRLYQKNREEFRLPEQLQLREVVVLEEGGLPTAEERAAVAASIQQAVAGGKPLADAVAEHAQKGHTSNVIDIGWVSPGDLDPGLESVVWKLTPGALTEPVAGRGGLHLMQVVERREARVPAFAEVQEQIRTREQRRRMQSEVVIYMAELEKKSLIVAEPPSGAEGFRRFLGQRPQTEDERLGLNEAATPAATEMNPATTPMQDSTSGEPGALPEPKPTTNTPPPVVEASPPAADEPPPPPPGS
ncbi:MAG: peptidyl-prolyl cis-trans isomerase SurA [Acidobacteriota bacterium]|jgi:parvulin-like peptidyl-prolyl isomerase|nr:peptidyl-prolyl cis-trans isomerase SurA [Acidobacteriota bacterium]